MEKLRGGDEEVRERGRCCLLNPWLIMVNTPSFSSRGCVFVYTAVVLLAEDTHSVTSILIGNPTRDFREALQGSASLTEITRVGVAVNGIIQEKTILDDPVPEMAACRTDLSLSYHCVPSVHKHPYTHRHTV